MTQHIHIVLAVYKPDPAHFRQQIASLASQVHRAFAVLFVAADTVSQPRIEAEASAAGLRFEIVTPPAPLDAVRAFELGLAEALARAPRNAVFALCDQDDVWHPERLQAGLAALRDSGCDLVYGDARVVDADGALLHRSMFRMERRRRAPGLRGLLYRNTVTGMTTLFTRRLAEASMPFPVQDGVHFYHDLWLALVAELHSGSRYLDRALVDYRQHGGNAVGVLGGQNRTGFGGRRAWLRKQAASYALAMFLARTLVLRFGHDAALQPRLAPLKPFLGRLTWGPRFVLDAARLGFGMHPAVAGKALSFAAVAAGRSVWALRRALGLGLDGALGTFDERAYALSPGRRPEQASGAAAVPTRPVVWSERAGRARRIPARPVADAPAPTTNILVPTLNPTEMFAGIATALDIGLGLAARGLPVRFVATDLPVASVAASRAFVLQRLPLAADHTTARRVALACGVTAPRLSCHRDDRFLATAWWTAHMARRLIADIGAAERRFFYLIQDFEPHFYPWGSDFAGAEESYGFDFTPVFNTRLLRDYFTANGHEFARDALSFHPSIDIATYSERPRQPRSGPQRIALYGRPEVARNMFPLAIESLAGFIEAEGLGPADVTAVSVGMKHEDILLPGGVRLESLGKIPWSDYPAFLTSVDLGLSLMFSPHPSHPPIEMAAAGARVVTNAFGPKDLSVLGPGIWSAAPTTDAVTGALRRAWHAPEPGPADRRIDLSPLGVPLDRVIAALAAEIGARHAHSGLGHAA